MTTHQRVSVAGVGTACPLSDAVDADPCCPLDRSSLTRMTPNLALIMVCGSYNDTVATTKHVTDGGGSNVSA